LSRRRRGRLLTDGQLRFDRHDIVNAARNLESAFSLGFLYRSSQRYDPVWRGRYVSTSIDDRRSARVEVQAERQQQKHDGGDHDPTGPIKAKPLGCRRWRKFRHDQTSEL
jgi:hypothetical protein